MTATYCPECGQGNPASARFCMHCGAALASANLTDRTRAAAPTSTDNHSDWATALAAIVTFVGLRRMSRKTRQSMVVIVFLMLFFGCPTICGFFAFVLDWSTRLFQ